MGQTCSKQFDNVHEVTDFQAREQGQERFSLNSIKQQHKIVRPNSEQIKIGMISSKVESLKPYAQMEIEGIIKKAQREIDREQLHTSKSPFEFHSKVSLPQPTQKTVDLPTQHLEPLSLDFYHSLGLEQYHYRPIPKQFEQQYKDVVMCEQEDRNGVKYLGEWKDQGVIHGNGVMQDNVSKYIGQFRNGLKHFHGRQILTREVYEGEFQAGRRKGQGILYYNNQYVAKGIFDGEMIEGEMLYSNNNFYRGQFQYWKYHGRGTFFQADTQTQYVGTFVNGKLCGKGKIYRRSKLIYQGDFKDNLKQGYGQQILQNEHYKGQFSLDKRHGKGELTIDNIIYVGNFVNGKLEGNVEVFSGNKRTTVLYNNGVPVSQRDDYVENGLPQQWFNKVIKKESYQQSDRSPYNTSSFKLYGSYGVLYKPKSSKQSDKQPEQIQRQQGNIISQKQSSQPQQSSQHQRSSSIKQPSQIIQQILPQIPSHSQQIPTQQIPSQQILSQYIPTQQIPPQQMPSQSIRSQEIPSQQIPSQQMPSQHIPFPSALVSPSPSVSPQPIAHQAPPSQPTPYPAYQNYLLIPPPATIATRVDTQDNRLYEVPLNQLQNQLDNSIESTDINPQINRSFVPYQNYDPVRSIVRNYDVSVGSHQSIKTPTPSPLYNQLPSSSLAAQNPFVSGYGHRGNDGMF